MTDPICIAIREALRIQGVAVEQINYGTTFEVLGLDELDVVEITLTLEEKLQIKIDDNLMAKIKNVNQLVIYLKGLCK
jgi:acyl carrier protein